MLNNSFAPSPVVRLATVTVQPSQAPPPQPYAGVTSASRVLRPRNVSASSLLSNNNSNNGGGMGGGLTSKISHTQGGTSAATASSASIAASVARLNVRGSLQHHSSLPRNTSTSIDFRSTGPRTTQRSSFPLMEIASSTIPSLQFTTPFRPQQQASQQGQQRVFFDDDVPSITIGRGPR
jgi:hypothetical protein